MLRAINVKQLLIQRRLFGRRVPLAFQQPHSWRVTYVGLNGSPSMGLSRLTLLQENLQPNGVIPIKMPSSESHKSPLLPSSHHIIIIYIIIMSRINKRHLNIFLFCKSCQPTNYIYMNWNENEFVKQKGLLHPSVAGLPLYGYHCPPWTPYAASDRANVCKEFMFGVDVREWMLMMDSCDNDNNSRGNTLHIIISTTSNLKIQQTIPFGIGVRVWVVRAVGHCHAFEFSI